MGVINDIKFCPDDSELFIAANEGWSILDLNSWQMSFEKPGA